jgi:tryptophan-rich sensory protein
METRTLHKLLAMAGFGAATAAAAALGARSAGPDPWYRALRKPWFQPPTWVFAPVWTGLYALIAASGYRVWSAPPSPERTRALAFWGTQLGLNAAWSWLFFGQHNPRAALADISLLRVSIDAYAAEAEKVDPEGRWMMTPYRGWVGFATLLNASIVQKNPHAGIMAG